MNKLFNDTLFDDKITINKREYYAKDVALYALLVDDMRTHTDSDFIRAIEMELNVMISCMSERDMKLIRYHKAKVQIEYDSQILKRKLLKKRILWKELNQEAEFEKAERNPTLPPNDRTTKQTTKETYIIQQKNDTDDYEQINDEIDEVLF